jgi:guanylate kinase
MQLKPQSLKIIFSSPSGTGKTTLAKALIKSDDKIKLSISVTTRPKRKDEVDGQDYYFISKSEYDELLEKELLLESAEVFGYSYGTFKKQTEDTLASEFDILYDIDWQGALQLIKEDSSIVSIFILPPSIEILEHRLRNRDSDSEETMQRRLSEAKLEISKCVFYDYIIVNEDIEKSLTQIKNIITAERSKRVNLTNLQPFLGKFND